MCPRTNTFLPKKALLHKEIYARGAFYDFNLTTVNAIGIDIRDFGFDSGINLFDRDISLDMKIISL